MTSTMKTIYLIFITAILMAVAPLASTAQNDLPLYQNVISDDIDAQIDTASNVQKTDVSKKEHATTDPQHATNDIDEQLRNLRGLYLAGKYDEALTLSQTIHDKGYLSHSQENARQKYTIASFKEMEYNEKADSAVKIFYGKNPFYNEDPPDPLDPVPFKENISNYYTTPTFSAWAAIGQTIIVPVIDSVYVITDTLSMEPEYNGNNTESIQFGLEYHPWKFLSVSIAPTYTKYSYTRTTDRNMRAQFHYEETSKILSVPIRVEGYWYTGKGRWVPSMYAGASLKYILKSTYNAYTQVVGDAQYRIEDREHDLDDKTRLNYAVILGAKLNFNNRRITYFLDLGLSVDIKPFNNPDAAYSNAYLAYDMMYIPDIFHIVELRAMGGIKVNLWYKTVAKYGYGH